MSGVAGMHWGRVKPCGSEAAYRRHIRRREVPCEPCRRAANDAGNAYRRAAAARKPVTETAAMTARIAAGIVLIPAAVACVLWAATAPPGFWETARAAAVFAVIVTAGLAAAVLREGGR